MDFEAFIDILRRLTQQCNEENVSITWTIYPDYTEVTIEPFQPMSKVINEGSTLYYEFKGGSDDNSQ